MNLHSNFFGSSATLRIFAAAAMALLLGGWVFFAWGWHGAWLACQVTAFVLGMSSCCPLGGIATAGSVITLAAWLAWGVLNSAS
ncbi:MAG: hypothetical protein J0L73_00640 [Verrucomicrobia bacterium]|nr:hypothetical protein [Verrucomicrobiota bacterium]